MSKEQNVVWILGAGFSVPLGGPLFQKLISAETLRDLNNWPEFRDAPWNGEVEIAPGASSRYLLRAETAASIVLALYELNKSPRSDGMRLWRDAEQFLDQLAIAASEPKSQLAADIKTQLDELASGNGSDQGFACQVFTGPKGLTALHHEAIRFVAGACTTFLHRAEQSTELVDLSEQWDPYRRWFNGLVPGKDSIVTFNYDRVLNILTEHRGRQESGRDILLSPMGDPSEYFDGMSNSVVPVYHLHGHVGWRRSADGKHIDPDPRDSNGTRRDLAIAHKHPETAVIGVPGRHKLTLPSGLLKDVWNRATTAIAKAGAVVFVGYRFPQTDNMAKRRLLDALRINPEAAVHVVLGAKNDDVHRLRGMIQWTREEGNPPIIHEMYAEDFFAVFKGDGLFR